MTSATFDGVDFILKDLPTQDATNLKAALETCGPPGFRVLDKNVWPKEGGAAFLWRDVLSPEDVLSLGDGIDSLDVIIRDFPPNELARILLALLTVWRRLRSVRVELSDEEFMVMRAIKKGNTHVKDISAYTALPVETVEWVTEGLKNREYQQRVKLVEVAENGLTTRF